MHVDQVGLNHLTWIRAVELDGGDVLPDLLARHGDELADEIELPRSVLDDLGVAPVLLPALLLRARSRARRAAGGRAARADGRRDRARAPSRSTATRASTEKPALLEQRGGAFYSEAAVGLVRSLSTGDGAVHVVDVRNNGTLAGLADDDVVEVPARVTKDGAAPLTQAPLAPELLGLVQHVAAYERLAAEAATTRDHVVARKALLAHPLIGQIEMVDGLVDALVAEAVR